MGRGGGDDEEEEEKQEALPQEQMEADARVQWLGSTFLNCTKLKSDKWSKCMQIDTNRIAITGFLDKQFSKTLLLYLSNKDEIVPCISNFPPYFKKKSVYFMRSDEMTKPVPVATVNKTILYGDMAPNPLDHLSTLIDEVYLNLLTNPKNNVSWPVVVSQDVLRHFYKLKSSIHVVAGQVKGKTLLPMPPGAATVTEADKAIVHALETAVIDWSHQIKDVIKSNSAAPLSEGLNPGPMVEIDFWAAKAANLEYIYNQLREPKIKKIAAVLEKTKSSYYPAFKRIFQEVVSALEESNDINLFLKPLRPYAEKMLEVEDFKALGTIFTPMVHIIGLIWQNSKYFNTPARLIVLLQEICNDIITAARSFVEPAEVFKLEPEESRARLEAVLEVLAEFQKCFYDTKEKVRGLAERGSCKPWNFDHSLVFERLESFKGRLLQLLELFNTVLEFLKLEKIEIGGVQGKLLSKEVQEIFVEFQKGLHVFSTRTYDSLDPAGADFEVDHAEFCVRIQALDNRLGTVICKAFDDCSVVTSAFKLLDSFAGLLDRPIIEKDVSHKFAILIDGYDADLTLVKAIYDREREAPPLHHNVPPVAGALAWCSELRLRISGPMERLRAIKHSTMASEEARLLFTKYEEMQALLAQYSEAAFAQWASHIDEVARVNLEQTLLARNPDTKMLSVNFSPSLKALLREVRYLETLQLDIPDTALGIYKQNETFHDFIGSLDLIVSQYNAVLSSLLDVERPLVAGKLDSIDQTLQQGLSQLNWQSGGVLEYIQQLRGLVEDLSTRLAQAKSNVQAMERLMTGWVKPLYERKDGKKLLELDNDDKRDARYREIQAGGEEVHRLLAANKAALEAADGADWDRYVAYLDVLVQQGFVAVIRASLAYLLQHMNDEHLRRNDLGPLLEARVELVVPNIIFTPQMDLNNMAGFVLIMHDVIDSIYKSATLVHHLNSEEDYFDQVSDNGELQELKEELLVRTDSVIKGCNQYEEGLHKWSHLWEHSRQDFMDQFLRFGHLLTQDEIDASGEEGPEENPPKLAQFEAEIRSYDALHKDVMRMQDSSTVGGWFRIDANPFKQSLSVVVKKWSYMFTQHLQQRVVDSLGQLEGFITDTDAGLRAPMEEGDYHQLVDAMGHLQAVRNRTAETDKMFEPLHETIKLLAQYEIEMLEDVHAQLQRLPEEWVKLKKTAYNVKLAVAPLQANEVSVLRKKCDQFAFNAHEFREQFRTKAPFLFEAGLERAYDMLDRAEADVSKMEREAEALGESAGLFEVTLPDYRPLKDCRRETLALKSLWDMAALITSTFEDWMTTPWEFIDPEVMETESKKFVKLMRGLDKEVRGWDAFNGLDKEVKDIMVALRSVGELRNPAIRDRHWHAVTKLTGVKFTLTADTKLADLIKLELHRFEDDVRNVVDRATKELSMEKILSELDSTWVSMDFQFDTHERTNTSLLQSSEELVETLEDNQVTLQNLMTSRYVDHFLSQITAWQQKLATVDSVMNIWLEVQHTWNHLENIFIGSADIRAQLPEDSKRFDGIDADFKVLMKDAVTTPNVVEACCKEGLFELLENIQERLTLCEKSLAEYLETKRLAFPRFYFISSNDLLDILAKGNSPVELQVHLPKLFDNIARLEFEKDEAGEPTKVAVGMYSKEQEYVAFSEPCSCTGAVEVWLNRVVDTMRKTLQTYLGESIITYEEKPREQWLFDYNAQVALTSSQIWWTTEVNIAFGRLEEGYENALKEYQKKQVNQLHTLITLIQGSLSKNDRQKIMVLCTIDVHARDIVAKLIRDKEENSSCFAWQSQLRTRWDDEQNDCFANICDAVFRYNYEYLGNTPRLVITPLTDRCYITLTQSLHLIMGGAPAGPAGTGKTETTKDLGRALGMMVYVFNCSEQMDYKSVGNIYKGLAQSGSWGCFDEFNRIAIEVLSVVATQVKSILDAIAAKKKRFIFQGEEISLTPTCGIWITMNPGYAGRTELPENIKALFRPCSMVVPDLELICEIMLMAEGFLESKLLARKFVTLYKLNKELLSKQDHYDWGLRAIKSVLVVAGSLKRAEPNVPEEHILMRALRDFNMPKIVTDDVPVFMGLINDLFPKMDIPRKRNPELESQIRTAVADLGLQVEDSFVLKVVQLNELMEVRHSVFIIGPAGSGKTQIWKSLAKSFTNQGQKCVVADLNPKVVENAELYGFINPATREWKDGLFSSIMRDMANLPGNNPKWIIFDGDIDTMWIESLNTVMDDNKVLTLASNERIALIPSMRLVFEIGHLKYASPATVSRAGILYVNPSDLGWGPYVTSWIETREHASEKGYLTVLFEKYVPACLDKCRSSFKKVVPISEFSFIQTLCYLLDGLLTPTNTPPGCDKEVYETYFVFAAVWAFGGAMFQDQLTDYRVEFSKWWVGEFRTIKFPSQGTVYDYYVDTESKKFLHWNERVPKYDHDPELPLQAVLVHTLETIRLRFLLDMLADNRRPVMLVGNAGCGKTVLVQNKLNDLGDSMMVVNTAFNNYTTSEMLQDVLENALEKKAGRNFGPPGSKKLIYFIDDFNMPAVDIYGTQQPHTLVRQHLDYSHWYDRAKLTLKEIHNCQYMAAMNPTSGSFTINPRLQRHFCVFAVCFPGIESLTQIYQSITAGHFQSFAPAVGKAVEKLVQVALALHKRVSQVFLPTAIKFHYSFNLRDLSNIFQGVAFCQPSTVSTPTELVKLWMHEAERVYSDKMVNTADRDDFLAMQAEIVKKEFGELDMAEVSARPLMLTHFSQGIGDPKYCPVESFDQLRRLLEEALDNYNEVNAAMNLVLFEDAMSHICRINRMIESPRGNALLVGVGGSGKQSLARLASFISSYEVFQISLRKGYSVADLKVDLAQCYVKAGTKGEGIVFLLTDSQIANEQFLVVINDYLSSGVVPALMADDEWDGCLNAVRNEAKSQGIIDTRENLNDFFVKKVRNKLKIVLCFSPVGAQFRNRARRFPAVINCTMIDWFHEWPETALVSVSQRFIEDTELIPESLKRSVSLFMAYVHKTVNEASDKYLQSERRYNYTTPKTFLELIKLYKGLLERKAQELTVKMDRLENGLAKLQTTASQVDDLKAKLASQEVLLQQKNEEADLLLQRVAVDQEKVNKEKKIAEGEEQKVQQITIEVGEKQASCSADLAAAEPALAAAQGALDTLNKNNLTELKSFGAPPDAVKACAAAVMVLLAPSNKIPKDRSWKAAKVMMAKVDVFLDQLLNFDKENIAESNLVALRPYLKDPDFNPDFVGAKSLAAGGLCAWVVNIVTFYEVFCDVEPKRMALAQANDTLAASQLKLAGIQAKIEDLDRNLGELKASFEKATKEKLRCEEEAQSTQKTIELANRLVNGLASEKIRWADTVASFKEEEKTLCGDVLVASSFISYVGCFGRSYRQELLHEKWLPFIDTLEEKIPLSDDPDPLTVLTDEAQIASWNNEGLPSDRVSLENAATLVNAQRWPLLIDPQLQGVEWIKKREGGDLRIVRLGARGYLDTIEKAMSNGDTVLLENIGEELDPVLDPLIGRNTIKKGRYIKLGDKEVEYNKRFRLLLQTKMGNPHYPPEIQAQTTLINFTVTQEGLEDQLLASVVSRERPDLETKKAELTKQQNEFKIKLKELEDALLMRLSAAEGNFLGDTALVENLEVTKRTAAEIEVKVAEAKNTEITINETRERYRPVASRASLLYFLLDSLNKINPMYQFSLKAFNVVFANAMALAEPAENVDVRRETLIDSITYNVFKYTTRGLFERDKLIFTAQMCFQILRKKGDVVPEELDFLLRAPAVLNVRSPLDWLPSSCWGMIKSLSNIDGFRPLAGDIEGSGKRWKKLCETECPEKEKFPQEWKNKTALQKLCMLRALRPDRMTYAVRDFVAEKIGEKYVQATDLTFAKSFEESGPATPIFFILSPGVDPVKDVEALGQQLGFTSDAGKFHNVSLGQGQEIVAEQKMDQAYEEGAWVMLQNVHLVTKWLPTLEKKLEATSEGSHPDFRVFMSADPPSTHEYHVIPNGILQSSIKITNEPPTGMQSNVLRAWSNFNQDTLEMCSKENEFKSILFALCYFHAVVLERRKFGPQGWNRPYPFNTGDLVISKNVLFNYLEANSKVPWTDLRYIFGEIMYGGHISDDWDRRLCATYLSVYMQEELLEGELELAPGFAAPPNQDYVGYQAYVDEAMPPESPYLYGLHPNAEIGFLTQSADTLFRTILEMQPRDAAGGDTVTREDKVKQILDEILERLPDAFNVPELIGRCEDRTPYVTVALQECERMSILITEIRRALAELDLGLKGDLTISEAMDKLMTNLFLDTVPEPWSALAYPSLLGLAAWYADLLLRYKELEQWVGDFALPATVMLPGFFNPQSFLTAIMQTTARKNEWPLDKMVLNCDVTKKHKEDIKAPPREGSYVHGLYMEGARWDTGAGMIQDSKLKELYPQMPVMYIKAVPVDKRDIKNVYECPIYRTRSRGPTYVWTLNLKTKEKPSKWVLAGVSLLLEI